MPDPWTPRRHFNEDASRVASLLVLADGTPPPVQSDLARHAVAGIVGAMDAYLCDAYVGLLVAIIRGFRSGAVPNLPTALHKETLPIGPLLARRYPARANWALRMAARSRMERENMLQVGKVKDTFNPFLPAGEKLFTDVIDTYVAFDRIRLTRWRAGDLTGLGGEALVQRRKEVVSTLIGRIGTIVQRRHDIVHNCDRPKIAVQPLTVGQARAMVADVRDFVTVLDDHLNAHRVA